MSRSNVESVVMTTDDEYNAYLDKLNSDGYDCDDDDDCDGDYDDGGDDYDGQPDEYTEWQDVYGGDDWDQGQYDNDY